MSVSFEREVPIMDACTYARKSTNKFGQRETIENQLEICSYEAPRYGIRIVDTKTDTGTGRDDVNRPEIREMVDEAIAGKYKCVIMKGISRFFRDVEKGLALIKLFDRHGIRVITVEESFDSLKDRTNNGKLDTSKITMYLMFAEMESKKHADRIKLQQLAKARRGEWNQASRPPFGYSYDHDTKKIVRSFPDNYTAKLIFDLYDSGLGMRSIKFYLEGDNPDKKEYPTPSGKGWNEFAIRFILANPAYVGDVVYNKRTRTERTYKTPELFGKTKEDIWVGHAYNDESDWIVVKDAHEATVSRDQFNRIQSIIESKANRKGIRNNVGLLATIARCKVCGSSMTFKRGNKDADGHIKTRSNYYCLNYIKNGTKGCTSHHIHAEELEQMVIDDLKGIASNPEMIDQIFNDLRSQLPDNDSKRKKERQRLDKEVSNITSKMDKLLQKNMNGDITDQQFTLMNATYNKELETCLKRISELDAVVDEEKSIADKEREFRQRLQEILDLDNMPREKKRIILMQLVDRIDVSRDLVVDIHYAFG